MRNQITLTIDKDVYDRVKELPKRVSISEIVTFSLEAFLHDWKLGRGMTDEELDQWVRALPTRLDFVKRYKEELKEKEKKHR